MIVIAAGGLFRDCRNRALLGAENRSDTPLATHKAISKQNLDTCRPAAISQPDSARRADARSKVILQYGNLSRRFRWLTIPQNRTHHGGETVFRSARRSGFLNDRCGEVFCYNQPISRITLPAIRPRLHVVGPGMSSLESVSTVAARLRARQCGRPRSHVSLR